jgi:hypothetical protein
MRLDEIDLLGKKTATFDEIRKKHNVSYKRLMTQLSKGIKVEQEHVDDLNEFPDYYDRLEKVEKK